METWVWPTLLLSLLLGLAGGVLLTRRLAGRAAAPASGAAPDALAVREGLDRLAERVRAFEHQGVSWQSQLRQQVADVRHSNELLRAETGRLTTALRKPHVRGHWGELHLRRTVELAGMVAHCDFVEQPTLTRDGDQLRPDLIVRLAAGRQIVVDAKTPLEAYLDAVEADPDDPAEVEAQAAALKRHARQVRTHVEALSAKAYWSALPGGVEFVVLFLPSESCLAAALEADAGLLEHAAARNVVLASPTSLIAVLRAVEHGWRTEALVESTREIHELGRELYDRLAVFGGHLDRLGRALKSSVESYNQAIGSLESRVLVTARQFEEIGVSERRLSSPEQISTIPRAPRGVSDDEARTG